MVPNFGFLKLPHHTFPESKLSQKICFVFSLDLVKVQRRNPILWRCHNHEGWVPHRSIARISRRFSNRNPPSTLQFILNLHTIITKFFNFNPEKRITPNSTIPTIKMVFFRSLPPSRRSVHVYPVRQRGLRHIQRGPNVS